MMDGAWRPEVDRQLTDEARAAVITTLRKAADAIEQNPETEIEGVLILTERRLRREVNARGEPELMRATKRSNVWLATDPFAPRHVWTRFDDDDC